MGKRSGQGTGVAGEEVLGEDGREGGRWIAGGGKEGGMGDGERGRGEVIRSTVESD